MAAPIYPPPGHILRMLHLGLDQTVDGEVATTMPVTPYLLAADGGARLGAIATMVDMAAGVLAVQSTKPDWTATHSMTVHRLGSAPAGAMLSGTCRLTRAGKNTVVSEVFITCDRDGDTVPIAYAEVTYARFPRPVDRNVGSPSAKVNYAQTEPPLAVPLEDLIGFKPAGFGTLGFDLSDPIRNSFGSIQGGMVTVALEEASLQTARKGAVATSLHVTYIAAAKVGPYLAQATVLRTTEAGAVTCRADINDVGHERLLSQGTVIVE